MSAQRSLLQQAVDDVEADFVNDDERRRVKNLGQLPHIKDLRDSTRYVLGEACKLAADFPDTAEEHQTIQDLVVALHSFLLRTKP